jgi:hypothetical protein
VPIIGFPSNRIPSRRIRGIDAHARSEVDLADDEEIGPRDPDPRWRAIPSPAATSITNIRAVGQVEREGRGKVVASPLDDGEIAIGEVLLESPRRLDAQGRVSAKGEKRVRCLTQSPR